jgi:hypothetical protein
MASNSALVVSQLDFDTIRSNLSTYLKGQTQFKDYDFDGSNLSVLLDVLSYNTYMNNFYTNMAISEMFLDSAQIMDSVVSRAKELNYTPRSYTSAVSYVDISIVPNDSPATITIPKGTPFTSRIDNTIYTFTTDQSIIVTSADNYIASNVAIYEGTYVTETFSVDTTIDNQRFVLNNTTLDTSSLDLKIQNSSTDTTNTAFIQTDTLLGYKNDSKIFFVQAADKNRYELIFGDDIIGVRPINGNLILASYRTSKGAAANKADKFIPASTIAGYSTSVVSVTTNVAAYGGSERETMNSIKYNAPRHYQTQNRAITIDDYRTILLSKYPDIRAINVYGGEVLNPPQYGTVFISVDLSEFAGVPDIVKSNIQSYILTKMSISIEPKVVDADYTYIGVNATASYNLNASSKTEGDIKNIIFDAIKTFNTTYLNDFNKTFRYSKLASTIDSSDDSIINSNLITTLIKKISPTIGTAQQFSLDYQNALKENTLKSDVFEYSNVTAYLYDIGGGQIAIVTSVDNSTSMNGQSLVVIAYGIGTINYTTGLVSINLPELVNYTGNHINILVSSAYNDFSVKNNTVLRIDNADINITVSAARA